MFEKFSKIGKVMRHIGRVEDFPADTVYKFRERARALANRWAPLLQKDPVA
jgi:hypothetical protein